MNHSKQTSSKTHMGITNPNSSELQRKVRVRKESTEETNENVGYYRQGLGGMPNNQKKEPKNFMSTTISAASKKILVERNTTCPRDSCETPFHRTPEMKPTMGLDRSSAPSETMLHDRVGYGSDPLHSIAYDHVTNYTSPRPEFLRYDPNRRREIFQRIAGELKNEEGSGFDWRVSSQFESVSRSASPTESSASSQSTFQEKEQRESKDGHIDPEDSEVEEEMEEERPPCSSTTWKVVLLLGVLLFAFYYMSVRDFTSVSYEQENDVLGDGLPRNTSSLYNVSGDKLVAFLGLSKKCLNVNRTEVTCGYEDIYIELLGSVDYIGAEGFGGKESQDGFLKARIEDLKTGNEGIGSSSLTLDMSSGLLSLDEIGSDNGVKLVAGKDEDKLFNDGMLGGCDNVFEGKGQEAVDSKALSEFSEVSKDENESQEPLLHQDAELGVLGSFKAMSMSVEENSMVSDFTNSFGVPQSQFSSSTPSDDQRNEDYESHNSFSEIEFNRDYVSLFRYTGMHQSLQLFLSLTVIILGVLGGLYKCLRNQHLKLSPAFSLTSETMQVVKEISVANYANEEMRSNSILQNAVVKEHLKLSPAFSPTSETMAVVKEISVANSANEEMRSNSIFQKAKSLPLRHSLDEPNEFRIRPPIVELLAEFSIAETTPSGTSVGQKSTKSASKQLQQSPIRKRVRKNPASSSSVFPSPSEPSAAVEAVLDRSCTTPDKLLKKEDMGDKRDLANEVITPLRRSSRLRNRVTSP